MQSHPHWQMRWMKILPQPWGFELGPVPNELLMVGSANLAALYHTYKQKAALKAVCRGKGLHIDTQIRETKALTYYIDIEARSIHIAWPWLTHLWKKHLTACISIPLNHELMLPEVVMLEIRSIFDDGIEPDKRPSRIQAVTRLLNLACKQQHSVQRVIFGIAFLEVGSDWCRRTTWNRCLPDISNNMPLHHRHG